MSRRATAEVGAAARAAARRATALIVSAWSSLGHGRCRAVQSCRRRVMRNARMRREDVLARGIERDSEPAGATGTSGRIRDGRRRRRCARRVGVARGVDARGHIGNPTLIHSRQNRIVATTRIRDGL